MMCCVVFIEALGPGAVRGIAGGLYLEIALQKGEINKVPRVELIQKVSTKGHWH
jgi:hypothetical protein